jgi:hypothetical protein
VPRLSVVSIPLRKLAAQPRRIATSRIRRSLAFWYKYTNPLLPVPSLPGW